MRRRQDLYRQKKTMALSLASVMPVRTLELMSRCPAFPRGCPVEENEIYNPCMTGLIKENIDGNHRLFCR